MAKEKVMEGVKELKMQVERKVFISDDGEKIGYYEYSATIGGEKFIFKPRSEDKKLLEYFLKCSK